MRPHARMVSGSICLALGLAAAGCKSSGGMGGFINGGASGSTGGSGGSNNNDASSNKDTGAAATRWRRAWMWNGSAGRSPAGRGQSQLPEVHDQRDRGGGSVLRDVRGGGGRPHLLRSFAGQLRSERPIARSISARVAAPRRTSRRPRARVSLSHGHDCHRRGVQRDPGADGTGVRQPGHLQLGHVHAQRGRHRDDGVPVLFRRLGRYPGDQPDPRCAGQDGDGKGVLRCPAQGDRVHVLRRQEPPVLHRLFQRRRLASSWVAGSPTCSRPGQREFRRVAAGAEVQVSPPRTTTVCSTRSPRS